MAAQIEQRFIEELKRLKAEHAEASLTKPSDHSEFGFGKVCGTYQGLVLAEQLFARVIGEEDDRT